MSDEVDSDNIWLRQNSHRNFRIRPALPSEQEGLDLPRRSRPFVIVQRSLPPIAFAASADFDPEQFNELACKAFAAELSGERGRIGRVLGRRWADVL
jgi:hypothetical protein